MYKLLLFFFIITDLFAQEVFLPNSLDQKKVEEELSAKSKNQYDLTKGSTDEELLESFSKSKDKDLYLPGSSPEVDVNKDKQMDPYTGQNTTVPVFKKSGVESEILSNNHLESDQSLSNNKKELAKKISSLGNRSYGLTFYKDNFDYQGKNNIFDRTFRGKDADFAGMVVISGDYFWLKNIIYSSVGLNFGVGYNGGKGKFANTGAASKANFKLWTLPIDGSFGLHIPLTRFIRLSGFGGPSVMGLMQRRSDFEEGNAKKNIRQVSFGYFASASIGISISDIFSSNTVQMFDDNSVTKSMLKLEARTQNYENFKETGTSISGTSFGVGFVFDFL